MDEFLKNGTYPKDLYLRFYFDKSILCFSKYLINICEPFVVEVGVSIFAKLFAGIDRSL